MRTAISTLLLIACGSAMAAAATSPISKSQFPADWPLTVDAGTLNCEPVPGSPNLQLVTFTSGAKTYALNGTAGGQAAKRGWLEVRPIWRDNPAIAGTKLSIGPLINRGLALCK